MTGRLVVTVSMGLISTAVPDGGTSRSESCLSRLGNGLVSARLAIVLSLMVTMIATLGTVIQPSAGYVKEYGVLAHWLLVELGFAGLSHSWLFLGLLVLLGLTLCAWLMQRFPSTWDWVQQYRGDVTLPLNPDFKPHHHLELKAGSRAVPNTTAEVLVEEGPRFIGGRNDRGITKSAVKSMMGRIWGYVSHCGVLVILVGGIMGVTLGFARFGSGVEGESYYIPHGDFHLRLDRFWAEQNNDSTVTFSNTTLTVIEQGKEILTKTIRVDDPLVYKDIEVYPAGYGDTWDRIEKVGVRISDKATGKALK